MLVKMQSEKKLLISLLILIPIFLVGLALTFSDRFNNLIFSKLINPYDPLISNISESKVSQTNAALVVSSKLTQTKMDISDGWKDPRGLFPIFAFNLPEYAHDLTGALKVIEKGGINIIINGNLGWMPYPYNVKEAFKNLGNSNLKWLAIIENECKDDFIYRNSNDDINGDIKKYLSEFNDDFIYGWYIWDEPGNNRKLCTPMNLIPNDDNEDINRMVKQVRSDSIFSKKLDFINLFPSYWSGTPTSEDYEKYIDAFISSQKYKPRVLGFDHYPNLKESEGGFRRDFYSNLSIIRKKSLEYDIPFWMIVLSSEHLSYRKTEFEDISLQVYSALAYGAKGIGYYLYSKCWEHVTYKSWILENYVDDPTVPDSLHGPLFGPIQNLNKQVQVLGKILSGLESVDIIHTSDYPNKQKNIAQSLLKKNEPNGLLKEINVTEDANADPKLLIGVFKNVTDTLEAGKYLLIVNKDVSAKSNIGINLNKQYRLFKFNKETGEKKFIANDDNFSSIISPGLGELFYVE